MWRQREENGRHAEHMCSSFIHTNNMEDSFTYINRAMQMISVQKEAAVTSGEDVVGHKFLFIFTDVILN